MKYYSSMTLADYISANWMELPQELVALWEREGKLICQLEVDVENWKESYDCVRDDAEKFCKAVEDAVDEYTFGHGDVNTMVIEIRDLCKHLDLYEGWF